MISPMYKAHNINDCIVVRTRTRIPKEPGNKQPI